MKNATFTADSIDAFLAKNNNASLVRFVETKDESWISMFCGMYIIPRFSEQNTVVMWKECEYCGSDQFDIEKKCCAKCGGLP